jgi:hypothetical protein
VRLEGLGNLKNCSDLIEILPSGSRFVTQTLCALLPCDGPCTKQCRVEGVINVGGYLSLAGCYCSGYACIRPLLGPGRNALT